MANLNMMRDDDDRSVLTERSGQTIGNKSGGSVRVDGYRNSSYIVARIQFTGEYGVFILESSLTSKWVVKQDMLDHPSNKRLAEKLVINRLEPAD